MLMNKIKDRLGNVLIYLVAVPFLVVFTSSNNPTRPGHNPHRTEFLNSHYIKERPSPNFDEANRGPGEIDSIVIHTLQAPFTQGIRWLRNEESGVSAHYVISRDGTIARLLDPEDIAWHARYYNDRSIGIECAGYAGKPETWTPELLDSLARLVAYLTVQYRIPVLHPDREAQEPDEHADYEQPLDVPGILSHQQIDPARREDPGPHFDWEDFLYRVRSHRRRRGYTPEGKPLLEQGEKIPPDPSR